MSVRLALAAALVAGALFVVTPASSSTRAPYDKLESPGLNVVPVWADSPGNTWPQARYDQMHSKGFGVVRFMLHWKDFEPTSGQFDATALKTLDVAIARAKAAALNVVLVPI